MVAITASSQVAVTTNNNHNKAKSMRANNMFLSLFAAFFFLFGFIVGRRQTVSCHDRGFSSLNTITTTTSSSSSLMVQHEQGSRSSSSNGDVPPPTATTETETETETAATASTATSTTTKKTTATTTTQMSAIAEENYKWHAVNVFTGNRTEQHLRAELGAMGMENDAWFSQAGQDLYVLNLLNNKQDGYFIDLAANNAIFLSNTLALESKAGWKGLCIEPNPAYWYSLAYHRKCDVV